MGTSDEARSSQRNIKKDYRALGAAVKDSGVQVVVFHQSSQSKGRGLKGPVKSHKSTDGCRTGATDRGLSA